MFGSALLDITIGLIFVYLLLSLICSAINELIEAWIKKRATHLEQGIRELLQDPNGTGLVAELYKHPLVSGLFVNGYKQGRNWWGKTNLPSYIPSRNFALALMDIILPGQNNSLSGATGAMAAPTAAAGAGIVAPPLVPANLLQQFRDKVSRENELSGVRRALLALVDAAGGDARKVRENIEAWYDSAMDRVAGWYKRYTQVMIFFIGLAVTIAINADTINIATNLAKDKTKREAIVALAEKQPLPTSQQPQEVITDSLDKIEKLNLPIGWEKPTPSTWWLRIIGWLITASAVSLGAPFWFDLLNKFMVIRSTVKPKEKSPEEKSQG